MDIKTHSNRMKRHHFISCIVLFFTILAITVKLWQNNTQGNASSLNGNNTSVQSNPNTDSQKNMNVIKTPFGKIRFQEHIPVYNMIPKLRNEGFIENNEYDLLVRMGIRPWQVYLDERKNVVKITIHKVVQPTISINQQIVDDLASSGYDILGSTGVNIRLDDQNMMKHFAKLMQENNYLQNSTLEEDQKYEPDELEMYPVMASYHGHSNNNLKDENLAYLSAKEMPMLLVIENRGFPHINDNFSDEVREVLIKYDMQNCMWLCWSLLPLPRNDAEAEWFAKAPKPNSIGNGNSTFAPTVSAWERVHGKKYIEP